MARETKQRAAIRTVVEEADRPLSPAEILLAAKAAVPGIGLATVYRTVRGLLEEGWLASVELPGRPPMFERAGKDHHHHFHCRACGGVYEVSGCPTGLRALAPAGFEIEGHELVLYGRCVTCLGRGGAGGASAPGGHSHGEGVGHAAPAGRGRGRVARARAR